MGLRVHHLNCTTLRPPCARLLNGKGSLFSRGRLVCHCLLIEGNDGLILVDTALGLTYIADPRKQIGRFAAFLLSTPLDPAETAIEQVARMGFSPKDVRHIVITHLDMDHAGGLPDFPDAQVHLLALEHAAAMNPLTSQEKSRYIAAHWAHSPQWVLHPIEGEKWFGFENVQEIIPDVLLIPMVGHTRGHCAVGVKKGEKWLLHCGDVYTDRREINLGLEHCPPGARMHKRATTVDRDANARWPGILRELVRNHGDEVSIISSHDPDEFSQYQNH